MAPKRTPEEAEELIREFSKRESELARDDSNFDKTIDRADRAISLAYVLIGVIAAVTLWAGRMTWMQSAITDRVEATEKRIAILEATHTADQLLLVNLQNTIASNKAERLTEAREIKEQIVSLEAIIPEVTEMWFMKQHGVSNKEDFEQRNGYAAPIRPVK